MPISFPADNSKTSKKSDETLLLLALVGDSDIEFWPSELLPCCNVIKEGKSEIHNQPIIVRGKSGATMKETLPLLRILLEEISSSQQQQQPKQQLILIACAGENDIGNGISLDSTVSALQEFLDLVHAFVRRGTPAECDTSSINTNTNTTTIQKQKQQEPVSMIGAYPPHIIFLGPKFEPWLEDDLSYKKKYTKLSRSFQRCCEKHPMNEVYHNLHYIDCLTMFCDDDSATLPGAVLGGRAKAEYKYFQGDKLHLSNHGYQIWKQVIENMIKSLLTQRL